MDTSDEHFDCLCRTCMNELVQATPQDGSAKPLEQWQFIFDKIEEEGSAFAIAELLSNAVPQIEVQPSDELPKSICSKCVQQLLSFYRFQRMCLQSEEQMRQQITKKRACFEMIGEAMDGEIGTNDTDSYPLTSFQPNNTDQNIVHFSIPRRILETTEQMVEPDATKTSDIDKDQLLENSNGSQGELVKNEPIEDDEPSFEYTDGETMLSALPVKDEEWSIDTEEQQISETNVKALGIAQGEGEPYEYPHCSRRFRTVSDMLQHKAIHKMGTLETCDICGKSMFKKHLKTHKLIHSDKKPHKCDFCEKSFGRHHTLRVHIRSHTGEKPYKCKYCESSYSQNIYRMKHMRLHFGDNIHRCELCPSAFPIASELRVHLTTHKNDAPETRERNLKALKEVEAELLRVHIRSHTGEKPYKCKYCDRSFAAISLRAQHMRFHLGANIYRCELCPLAFPLASELRVHFLTHTNEDPETRERNMQALKEAEAIDRGNVESHHKPYECPYCPRRFREKSYMLQHKATHEEGERERETCDICGKSMRKKHLKTHKLIHSDQKLHKCDFCEKSFAQLSNLRRHIRSHTDERPYKCKYCERTFANYTSHVYHMRNHLGDNIHRCEVCPLAFPVASELRVHLTTHKNDDSETRKRNLKALKEVEAKLQLRFSKQKTENVEAHPTIHGEDKCYDCPEGVEKETCDICGKSIIKRDLKTHKLIHSDQKRHKCDFCQKSFTRKDYLRVHINKHTGEKPYKCKYCDRSFAGITLRRQHSRRIHLGANVHRCELCPLAFPLASELRVHLTTHKNEDPESRERNMKALKEAEAKLQLKLCKKETRQSLRGVAGTT